MQCANELYIASEIFYNGLLPLRACILIKLFPNHHTSSMINSEQLRNKNLKTVQSNLQHPLLILCGKLTAFCIILLHVWVCVLKDSSAEVTSKIYSLILHKFGIQLARLSHSPVKPFPRQIVII